MAKTYRVEFVRFLNNVPQSTGERSEVICTKADIAGRVARAMIRAGEAHGAIVYTQEDGREIESRTYGTTNRA